MKPLHCIWHWISCIVTADCCSHINLPETSCGTVCVCCSEFCIPGKRLGGGAGGRRGWGAVSHVQWITASHAAQEKETHAEKETTACKVQQRRRRTIKSTTSPLARVWGAQWDVVPSPQPPPYYHRWLWFPFKALLYPGLLPSTDAVCPSQTCREGGEAGSPWQSQTSHSFLTTSCLGAPINTRQ